MVPFNTFMPPQIHLYQTNSGKGEDIAHCSKQHKTTEMQKRRYLMTGFILKIKLLFYGGKKTNTTKT